VLESLEQLAQGKEIPKNVLVYRIFGPFLFGAAEKMSDALERVDQLPRVLILRLHLVTAMDATALNALESIIERFSTPWFNGRSERVASAAVGDAAKSRVHRRNRPGKSVCSFRCSAEPGESALTGSGSVQGPCRLDQAC
jgi:MFS superfamily sulfate permease-like transporter